MDISKVLLCILKTLKEFEGITGAVLGVFATLVTTKWLESWGKLQYYFDNLQVSYLKIDRYGDEVETEPLHESEHITVKFKFEVYNSSDVIKSLRNIKALIISENNRIVTKLIDDTTYKVSGGVRVYEELLYINFMPKEVTGYNLRLDINQSSFKDNKIEKIKRIYLTATNINNREVKVLTYKN